MTNWICVGNGQLHQVSMLEIANTLDTMHDAQIVERERETVLKWHKSLNENTFLGDLLLRNVRDFKAFLTGGLTVLMEAIRQFIKCGEMESHCLVQ